MKEEIVEKDITLYLTFHLDDEVLALEVSKVREVLDLCPVTRVPKTPEHLIGVVNLRGTIIPVIDLRLRFGLSRTEATEDARIVILEVSRDGADAEVGIMTDSVHDVVGISDDQVNPPQDTGDHWRTEYINGIGKYGEDFILLLDIQRVITDQEPVKIL